jgi:ABC-type branched-subunit amino acid transport system substrate-binding protein
MADFVFSSGFSVEATGLSVARFMAKNLHLKRVAIISNSTVWSSGITEAFRKEFLDNEGEVVFDEAVNDTWTDFRPLVSRISRQKPTAIYLPLSLPGSVEACIKQIRQNGLSVPVFTGEAFVGDAAKRLGKLAHGIYVAWLPNPDPRLRARYQSQYGEPPWDERIVQVGLTGMMQIAAAAESRKSEPLKDALLQHFGPTRSVSQELALYRVTEAGLVLVEAQ